MEAPQEPRWLCDEETKAWLALVSLLIRRPSALDAQLQRDAGISHFGCQGIAGLSMSPGRTQRMSEPARFVDGSLSRLSQVVSLLEQRGWVRRTLRPDRRPLHPRGPDGRRLGQDRRHRVMRAIDPDDHCL